MWDDEEALSELIQAVKVEARQRVRDDRARVPDDVAKLLDVMERRMFEAQFDVSALYRECRPGRATLWRFRAALNLNPKAYLNLRLSDAARCVVSVSTAPLAMIARAFGYADPELFSKWLKWQTGKSPRELRAEAGPGPQRSASPRGRTIQRFRRLVLGGLGGREAASWVRHFCAGDEDGA